MKTLKFLLPLVLIVGLFSGCGEKEPDMLPEEVVDQGLDNVIDITSASYELTFTGDAVALAEGVASMSIKGSLGGVFDKKDVNNPVFSMKIDGVAEKESGNQTVGGELRIMSEALYFILTKLEGLGQTGDMYYGMLGGKWWQVPMQNPEEGGADYNEILNAQQEQYKNLIKNANLLKNIKYIDTKKVNGTKAYHYSFELDKDGLAEYSVQSALASGVTLDEASEKTMREEAAASLELINLTGEIWVSVDMMTIVKIAGNFSHKNLAGAALDSDFEVNLNNINGDVSVETPTDAILFDASSLLGGFVPAGGGAGAEGGD